MVVLTALVAPPPLPLLPAGYGGTYSASGYDYRYASLAAAGYSGSELGMGAEQARAAAALPAAVRAGAAASSAPLVVQEVPLKQGGAGAEAGGGPTEEELMKRFRERLYRSRGGTAEEEEQPQGAAAAQVEAKEVRGWGCEVDSRSCQS